MFKIYVAQLSNYKNDDDGWGNDDHGGSGNNDGDDDYVGIPIFGSRWSQLSNYSDPMFWMQKSGNDP